MSRLTVRAAAKVNLHLTVLRRLETGFHEIRSLFQAVDLFDDVRVESAGSQMVTMSWADRREAPLPVPEENLVMRALARFPGASLRAEVVKRIPIGAGLGGGSADAAAALYAASTLDDGHQPTHEKLRVIGSGLGSDVPFWFSPSGTALVTGAGERVTPLEPARLHLVLGLSDVPLLTRDVYEAWAPGSTSPPTLPDRPSLDTETVTALLRNDLEAPAFSLRPELEEKKETMRASGALGVVMSGSGPTMVGVARDVRHAHEIAARVHGEFDRVACVASCDSPLAVGDSGRS